jgi:hypothetical protein
MIGVGYVVLDLYIDIGGGDACTMMEMQRMKELVMPWRCAVHGPKDEYTRRRGLIISTMFSAPRCDALASQQQVVIIPLGA